MRQPVIEYTIQFYMHAATYTHVHTTLPPHTNSCESDRQRVLSATSNESDKKQNGDCDTKNTTTQCCKMQCCEGRRRTHPE